MRNSILFLIVVFLSNIIQAITGFAGTVLAMPFSVMLIGYTGAKAILNTVGLAASVGVVILEFKHINFKEFGKMTGLMLPGIVAGHFIAPYLAGDQTLLYKLLGSIVILFAAFNLYKFFRKQKLKKPPLPLAVLLIACAGLVHGMFVCGGPMLIVYAAEQLEDKEEFRSTVSSVWIVLNGIMLFTDLHAGNFSGGNTVSLLWISLAVLVAALFIGNFIEHKMNKRAFMMISYILMVISGASLLIK